MTGIVLGNAIDVLDPADAVERVLRWARLRESRSVVAANVHLVVSAWRDPGYRRVVNAADLALPDGAPVAWLLRRRGHRAQRRIGGPDLMWALLAGCEESGIGVYLYGGGENTLAALAARVSTAFPRLRIAGAEAPPFRPLTRAEDLAAIERIEASRAGIVFVALGCPRQECWIAAHRGKIDAVMLGVGAAFDFHAGTIRRAPTWMREHGLEWLHRLAIEPRRLWKRYLLTNSLFLLGAAGELLRAAKTKRPP